MDFNSLVDEIARKVMDKMREQGAASLVKVKDSDTLDYKPCAMVLAQTDQNRCRCLMESGAVSEHYEMDLVLPHERERDIAHYQTVILFDLTCDALAKIATGVTDTEYTALASQAILMGKKVLVPKEEIELFRYRDTAPASYYKMMLEKLNFMAESGVAFCDFDKLESELIARKPVAACTGGQIELDKRVVTESDIRAAWADGVVCVTVRQSAIITDLAGDYAKDCGISIKKK